jgi:hypothetical protein
MNKSGCLGKCVGAILLVALFVQFVCDGFASSPPKFQGGASAGGGGSETAWSNDVHSVVSGGCGLCRGTGNVSKQLIGMVPATILGALLCLLSPIILLIGVLGIWALANLNRISALLTLQDTARQIAHELKH